MADSASDKMNTPNEQLLTACKAGTLPPAQQAVTDGADVNCSDSENGSTPIMWAIDNQHSAVTEWLLSLETLDVNVNNGKNKSGITTLHYACWKSDRQDIVTKVAMLSDNVNETGNNGETPLQGGVERGNAFAVFGLQDVPKVDWKVKDKNGKSLADIAR